MISHRLMMGCGEVKSLGKQEIKAACSQPLGGMARHDGSHEGHAVPRPRATDS